MWYDPTTIHLTNADSNEVDVDPGDKVIWHNDTSDEITLHPPSCVSPGGDDSISPGQDSRQYTVNNNANGDYSYTFDVGAELGVRNGRIKVN
jgi:hypothetical protein